jgi:hypothetical protein
MLLVIISHMEKKFPRLKKAAIYGAIVSSSALGGAVLSSHFEHAYHSFAYSPGADSKPYLSEAERGKLEAEIGRLGLEPLADSIMDQIQSPRVFLYGAAAPAEVRLEFERLEGGLRMTYWCLWNNDGIIPKADWEPLTLIYSITGQDMALERAYVRPHNEVGEYTRQTCARLGAANIPVVVGNPAHTLGIPGCEYSVEWGPLQAFTRFAMEDWAGSSVSIGLPQGMSPQRMILTIGSPPASAKDTPFFRQ